MVCFFSFIGQSIDHLAGALAFDTDDHGLSVRRIVFKRYLFSPSSGTALPCSQAETFFTPLPIENVFFSESGLKELLIKYVLPSSSST